MNIEKLTTIVRQYLYDTEKKQWSDAEIIGFLEVSAKAYSTDSELFRGTLHIVPDADGDYHKPGNFVRFMCGWNRSGEQIKLTTSNELYREYPDYYPKVGESEAVYDDLSDQGQYRLFPKPPDGQNRREISAAGYGEIAAAGYGVVNAGWGVTASVVEYDYAGEFQYIRSAGVEEISDHMALVYYACSLACNVDTEFADPERGNFFKMLYNRRIGQINQLKRRFTGTGKNACYY